jgi:hypothetical protein
MPGDSSGDKKATANAHIRVPEHVVYRSFGSETILLNLSTGEYHGLNLSGGRMFEILAETGSPEAAAERVADEFGQPVEAINADLAELCDDLVGRGLIEIQSNPG